MGLLENRHGIVFGVANDHSIAWGITRRAAAEGAKIALGYGDERLLRRVGPLAESIESPLVAPCDVTDDAQLDAFFARAAETFGGRLDFVVHSVAFADREDLVGDFTNTRRAGFALAMDVSAYSLVAMARRAAPFMTAGGSILTLTYYGAEKAVPRYNVMGPAKAALEASVRYLAADLGPKNIRVNAISAGPIKTLAAAGIPGFREILGVVAERAPLRRNVTLDDVAGAALFLLSDLGAGVTAETLHVDAGYNAVGL